MIYNMYVWRTSGFPQDRQWLAKIENLNLLHLACTALAHTRETTSSFAPPPILHIRPRTPGEGQSQRMKPMKSSPPKGQGTLFSFFSKKDPPHKEASPKSKPSPAANKATTPRNSQGDSEQSTKKAESLVGKRIKVFWKNDNEWYVGKVVSFSPEDGKHMVHYADGDKEKIVLAHEKVRQAPPGCRSKLVTTYNRYQDCLWGCSLPLL